MKEINIIVNGGFIRLWADSAREACRKFERIMKKAGIISDPELAKKKIKRFYELNGKLHIEDLIADWASMTNNDREVFDFVSADIEQFGSEDQKARFIRSEGGKAFIWCRIHEIRRQQFENTA